MCPAMSSVGITQGLSTTLEVYISGYPPVRSTNVHWYRLNPTRQEITSGATFHDSRRRMVLTDVQTSDTGMYLCEATIPLIGITQLRASATIDLQVYGQLHNGEERREREREERERGEGGGGNRRGDRGGEEDWGDRWVGKGTHSSNNVVCRWRAVTKVTNSCLIQYKFSSILSIMCLGLKEYIFTCN